MKRNYKIISIHGRDGIKWKHEFHHVELMYQYIDPEDNNKNLFVYKCFQYFQEEIEENMYYSDPDYEDYLMSDSYEADCKSEKWDWLKNEME